jgi:hypothetical protein
MSIMKKYKIYLLFHKNTVNEIIFLACISILSCLFFKDFKKCFFQQAFAESTTSSLQKEKSDAHEIKARAMLDVFPVEKGRSHDVQEEGDEKPNEKKGLTPENVIVSTPVYAINHEQFVPPLGQYTYTVSWQGIPAAESTLTVTKEKGQYKIETKARTKSFIDIFYKLRYSSIGFLSSDTYRPTFSEFEQQENSRHKSLKMIFNGSGDINVTKKNTKGQITEITFNPNNLTLDPYGASFIARAQNWEPGEVRQFDTYNGRSRYLITLAAIEKIKMDVNGVEKDVWVIEPKVMSLADMKSNTKLRKAKIYVTADKNRDIVKIWSEVFVGAVTTKLRKYEPLG